MEREASSRWAPERRNRSAFPPCQKRSERRGYCPALSQSAL